MITHINLIGCGRLGKTIGKLLHRHQLTAVNGIVNGSYDSAAAAVNSIGCGTACKTIRDLPPADIHVIATPDDRVQLAASELAAAGILKKGNVVMHCSGSLSSDVLNIVKPFHCYTASLHPLKSFANPAEAIESFAGTYCAAEGDDAALAIITPLFQKIGGHVFTINKEEKNLYHAAGVLANNYLVTLHYHAVQSYIKSGIDEQSAKKIVSMLMRDALNNLDSLSHEAALTGPIQRGDIQTIAHHLEALQQDVTVSTIYAALGQATLPLTNHLPPEKAALEQVFTRYARPHT